MMLLRIFYKIRSYFWERQMRKEQINLYKRMEQ